MSPGAGLKTKQHLLKFPNILSDPNLAKQIMAKPYILNHHNIYCMYYIYPQDLPMSLRLLTWAVCTCPCTPLAALCLQPAPCKYLIFSRCAWNSWWPNWMCTLVYMCGTSAMHMAWCLSERLPGATFWRILPSFLRQPNSTNSPWSRSHLSCKMTTYLFLQRSPPFRSV